MPVNTQKKNLVFNLVIVAAMIMTFSLPLFAGNEWVTDKQMNFKIKVPENYQRSRLVEGTDVVHAFLSPDQNVAVRIRSIPVNGVLSVDSLIQIFEQNIIKGAQRLLVDNYTLNSIPGKIGGYKWLYNNIPVGLAIFYTVQNNIAYVIWVIVPENLYKQRVAEGDAITNTFTLLSKQSQKISDVGAGAMAKKNKKVEKNKDKSPAPEAKPSKPAKSAISSNFFDLVSDDAKISHKVPNGFKLAEKEDGQSIWKNDAGIKMVIQTIFKKDSFENFVDSTVADIKNNGATVLNNMYTIENGLKVANYSYKYGNTYFAYGATAGTGVNYLVGFVGKMDQKDLIDSYSEEANLSLKAVE